MISLKAPNKVKLQTKAIDFHRNKVDFQICNKCITAPTGKLNMYCMACGKFEDLCIT